MAGPITRWLASARSGSHALGDVAHRRHVGGDVGLQLLVGEIGEGSCLHAVVAVGDVHREQPADVRPIDGAAHRLAPGAHPQLPALPRPHRVDPVQPLGRPVLGQEVDLVPQARQGSREAGVVDVGPRAAQQVAVEDEQPHRRASVVGWGVIARVSPSKAAYVPPMSLRPLTGVRRPGKDGRAWRAVRAGERRFCSSTPTR